MLLPTRSVIFSIYDCILFHIIKQSYRLNICSHETDSCQNDSNWTRLQLSEFSNCWNTFKSVCQMKYFQKMSCDDRRKTNMYFDMEKIALTDLSPGWWIEPITLNGGFQKKKNYGSMYFWCVKYVQLLWVNTYGIKGYFERTFYLLVLASNVGWFLSRSYLECHGYL